MSALARWDDLAPRVASGVLVTVVGLGAVWAGGGWLMALAALAAGLMLWEVSAMTAPARPWEARAMGGIAAATFAAVMIAHNPFDLAYLLVPSVLGLLRPRNDRYVFAAAAFVIMIGCYAVVAFREAYGLAWLLWVIALVAAVDILGYFGGRIMGGPKFWPRISPKKTWSGTMAGWAGAAAVGAGFWAAGLAPAAIVPFSALVAFASQMGDIAESAVKRRAGVKDASHLIPGHGGVMDRFDGLTGAVVFLLVWGMVFPVPQIGG